MTRPTTSIPFWILAGAIVLTGPLGAQERAEENGGRALLIEAVGAGGASFLTSGLYLTSFEEGACGDDHGCTFRALGGLALLSSGASVLGVHVADRVASTDPSLVGAAFGAVAGTVGGFLMASHWADRNDLTRALSFGLTQGLGAAIGSRLGALLR